MSNEIDPNSPPPKPKSSNRTGNQMNCARHSMLATSAALLLITLVGCSSNPGPAGVTTIVFDGQSQTLNGPISCTAQPDGKLVILATDTGQKTARVVLSRAHQLVVEKVGIRIPGASGFTEDSGQMSATKVDNTYQINGWMPPNAGETARHPFEIETTCRYEVPLPIPQPGGGGYGAP
jgi:Mycobacterium 19 kDa lipoprotein antigen